MNGVAKAVGIMDDAEQLHSPQQVAAALDRMAAAVEERLAATDPVIVSVLMGGLLPTAALVGRLRFPHQLDYLHASRYRGETVGGELRWVVKPRLSLLGRTVLLVDDILDEGITLHGICEACRLRGAAAVHTAVLVEKQHARRPAAVRADFVGLEVGDRYVFGCGMDYQEYWRNLPGIYALPEGADKPAKENT